ncbi:DUF3017 domain-containing protein [Streptomyces sp. NPDC050617]|uniref:DUF3017 domain-containing protein n=1 Tax=Streptomyces sp. NPDC050617 TaxID=3154628 RepID=UPI00343C825D
MEASGASAAPEAPEAPEVSEASAASGASEGSAASAAPGDSAASEGAASGESSPVKTEPRQGSTRVSRITQRFPSLTRGIARPEGGGRAAAGSAPAPARQWPLLSVLGGTGLGLLIVAFDAFRAGTIIIGLALIAGAVLRWALPSVGMLAVRSRFTDMVIYGALGAAIVLLSMMAQPHPWLKIPFLEDLLHFTVK